MGCGGSKTDAVSHQMATSKPSVIDGNSTRASAVPESPVLQDNNVEDQQRQIVVNNEETQQHVSLVQPTAPEVQPIEFPEDPLLGRTFEVIEEAKEVELAKGVTYRGAWAVRLHRDLNQEHYIYFVVYTYSNLHQNAKQEGVGEMKYSDGGHYIGEFRAGKADGLGIFTAKDGSQYRGPFKDGKAHGYGVYTFKDGTK